MLDSYTKVTQSLKLAALAAGTVLKNIIEVPSSENFESAFEIFCSAIKPDPFYGSYKPLEINLLFREGCSRLRKRIFDFASNPEAQKRQNRCINLRKWA